MGDMRLFTLLFCAILAAAAPICDDNILLTVTASATNLIIPSTLNSTTLTKLSGPALQALVNTLPTRSVSGVYTIAGRYCEPEVQIASRASTLQLLVHGVGYTRDYWSGGGLPGSSQQINGSEYSWADYASKQGYPTFSVDRLCNGRSTHLVGTECQIQLGAAALHEVIGQLRAGKVGGRAFGKIIWVGHSYGSYTANSHAQLYPQDVDAYLLTGYTLRIARSIAGAVATYRLLPASAILPNRYGALDPSYLICASRSGFETLFYYGQYEVGLVDIDFANRGTAALGEVVSIFFGQLSAPDFRGRVMVITGQNDQVVCGTSQVSALLGQAGDCGSGGDSAAAEVATVYPNAGSFSWAQPANTGHCMQLHTNAAETFQLGHNFVSSVV